MSIVGTKGADKLAKTTKFEQLSGAATKKLNEGAAAINVRTQSALQNLGLDNRLAYPGVGSVKGNGGYQFIERVDGGNGVGTKVRDESGKGTRNLIRKEAFNNAKDLAGVPRSQQPTRQWQVGDNINRKGGEYKNYEYSSNPTHHGRYYEYDTPQGKRVIVEHINDGRLHTHAGKPKDGANPFEYDFKKERYSGLSTLN
ncbi:HNH/endonuclease VII fold putative polymorphic toxin [Priestia flexa]|nr:HNH/endonuclease VII fold putative polymorphic toxin [Priestia flexa]